MNALLIAFAVRVTLGVHRIDNPRDSHKRKCVSQKILQQLTLLKKTSAKQMLVIYNFASTRGSVAPGLGEKVGEEGEKVGQDDSFNQHAS